MNIEYERSRMLRGPRWSELVMAISRNLTYVLSIVATLCAVAASSLRGEEADALYGATWVMMGGAALAILLMLTINYFVIEETSMSRTSSAPGDAGNSQSNQGGPGDRAPFEKIEDDLQSEAQGRAKAKPEPAGNPAGDYAGNDQPLPGRKN